MRTVGYYLDAMVASQIVSARHQLMVLRYGVRAAVGVVRWCNEIRVAILDAFQEP